MPQVIPAIAAAASWYASAGVFIQAAVNVAVSVIASAIATELASQNAPSPQGGLNRLSVASDSPRRLQIGKRANGGVLVDVMSRGNKNQFATLIIYLGEGRMGNVTGIWNGGKKVYTGNLTHGVKTELVSFRSPEARCWVTYYDGRPGQTADAATISEYPSRWTSNHVGTGVAYIVLSVKWDPDTMPAFPTFMYEVEGAYLYDRRLDSTAGGSGTQRLKDPSTWALSSNPHVALDHYLLGRWLSASDTEPIFGIGLDPETVPYDRFAALANLADENVNLKTGFGTQKRYAANGFMLSSDIYKDAILDLCRAANCRPADFGGKVSFIDNEAKASILTLTNDDLAGNFPESYKPKKSRSQLVGGVSGTYQDVANNYAPAEYPIVTDASYITEDGERLENGRYDLEMETSSDRAQRHAKAWLERQRRQAVLSGVYTARAMKLEDGDWFTRAGGKFGSGKVFEVIGSPIINTEQMTVAISAREVDPSNSAWNENDANAVNLGEQTAFEAFSIDIPSVSATAITYAKSPVFLPAIRFTNSDYNDDIPVRVEVELAEDDGAGAPTGEVINAFMNKGQENILLFGVLPDEAYVFRIRGVLGENFSDWSDWSAVTSSNQYQTGDGFSGLWEDLSGTGLPDDNATVGAVTGVNLLRNNLALLGDSDVITPLGIAAGFTGEGNLARLNNVNWGTLVTGRPAELTDGRVAAGLDSNGDLARNISTGRLDASNVLRFTSGGLYTGDLSATVGARAGVNLQRNNFVILSDSDIITISGIASGFSGEGDLARLDAVTQGQISVPNLAAINASLGAITGGSLNINGRFIVASDGTTQILSATTGARLALNDSVLEVYDASNTLRVRLGLW